MRQACIHLEKKRLAFQISMLISSAWRLKIKGAITSEECGINKDWRYFSAAKGACSTLIFKVLVLYGSSCNSFEFWGCWLFLHSFAPLWACTSREHKWIVFNAWQACKLWMLWSDARGVWFCCRCTFLTGVSFVPCRSYRRIFYCIQGAKQTIRVRISRLSAYHCRLEERPRDDSVRDPSTKERAWLTKSSYTE